MQHKRAGQCYAVGMFGVGHGGVGECVVTRRQETDNSLSGLVLSGFGNKEHKNST